MAVEWNRYLGLPQEALVGGKRIHKTVLVERAGLSKHEQQQLRDLKELSFYATVSKSSAGILPHVDDMFDIRAVVYLDCLLETWNGATELALILHRAFPNPTVLLMRLADSFGGRMVSVALKRKSMAEASATVVEDVESTAVLEPVSADTTRFWPVFAFDRLPQNDLLDYTRGMLDVIAFSKVYQRLGFMPRIDLMHRDEVRGNLRKLKQLDGEIRRLRAQRKDKDTTLGESADLRVLESGKTKEAQSIVDHIKELCHD